MATINLNHHQFSYHLVRKPIRSIHLRLISSNSFSISCPYLTPNFVIHDFIYHHSDWIIKNSSKIKSVKKISQIQINQYKQQAKKIITAELQQLSQKYHFNYGRVSVRNQKTRLGSCSHHGNLSFNWRIAFFPKDKFHHVLFHELVHLTIKNHSPRFWSALAVYDPHWHQNRQWIKSQAQSLPDNDPNQIPPAI